MEWEPQCGAASGYSLRAQSVPCFRPLTGYRSRLINPDTGKRSIVFKRKEADPASEDITLPCGQCRFCRLEHSRQWAVRCFHEASQYEKNCFLTLTYSDEHLPKYGFLEYSAPVLFMKRLRKKYGEGIRSFGCGEYGDNTERAHYHLIIFNHDFGDKEILSKYEKKDIDCSLYTSKELQELWPFGHSTIGDFTFETAAYVARYVTKKVNGKDASQHYEYVDIQSGEVLERPAERSLCVSRRPGIGKEWYERYGKFIRDNDMIVLRGKKMRPAKYYDRLSEIKDADRFTEVKEARKLNGKRMKEKLDKEDARGYEKFEWTEGAVTPKSRLAVMEEIQELNYRQLKRGL